MSRPIQKRLLGLLVLIIAVCAVTNAQPNSIQNSSAQAGVTKESADTVVMPAGIQFKASAWKSLWWGKHYRREWTTPVAFPVLKLSEYDGGLTPEKAGGGHESKTLRFRSKNGKEYVLRTIDKTLDALVPDDFKETFINDIVNDQISTAHPYGPIAIAHMSGSLSFMHTHPVIYYVPDDPALGEFRNVFADKLCLLEERPSGKGWEHSVLFGNADKIVNTKKMLKDLVESSSNQVDQRPYLDVRLFDLLVNDWDRHEDQWVWTIKKENGHSVYRAIARDRDQAFSKTDGINMYFLSRRWAIRSLQNIDDHVRDVRGANFAARNLDQQFLNQLTKDDWRRSVAFIQTHLTDSLIQSAIHAMPIEVNQISGDWLIQRLIGRRNNIGKDADRFYSIVSKNIVITGSADNEQFIVTQLKKKEIAVTGIRTGNDTFYHRVFHNPETKQINIYGLDGDDSFIVNAPVKNHFKIRMIGGEGNDQYTASQHKLSGKPFRVFDSSFQGKLSKKTFLANKRWDTIYRYNKASVNYDWYLPIVIPGYNPDDGFSIGLGLLYRRQQWGKTPFGWQQSFTINYATATQAVGFGYKGIFKQAFGKWDLDIAASYKGPRYTFNYYGLGNESEMDGNERSYFKVKANDLFVNPGISRSWKYTYLRFGLQYQDVKILRSQDKFATSPKSDLPQHVFSAINYAGVNGEWTFSNADERSAKNGIRITTGFSYLANLDSAGRNMLKLNAAVSVYHTFFNRLIFAHRTGTATVIGDYEFYNGNTLGGNENLRGFWRSRFTGKSSFYQNTELRLVVCDFKGYVVRGKFGVFSFVDDGRVWIENDNSSKLHTGYGGGIFLVPYKVGILSLYYSTSDEASMVTLRAGAFF